MCEILLCVKDGCGLGLSGDPFIDCKRFLQGDVIASYEDGKVWGDCELCGVGTTWRDSVGITRPMSAHPNGVHGFWRVVKLPNVTVAQSQTMLGRELPVDPLNPSPYLQQRQFYIDKTKIQVQFPNFYANFIDDLRTNPSVTVNATPAQIQACVTKRQPIPWP